MLPTSLMPIDQINNSMQQLNIPSFIDLEFEPIDANVYDLSIDSPFDVLVH